MRAVRAAEMEAAAAAARADTASTDQAAAARGWECGLAAVAALQQVATCLEKRVESREVGGGEGAVAAAEAAAARLAALTDAARAAAARAPTPEAAHGVTMALARATVPDEWAV